VFVMAATWKWHYYAPNTFKMLKIHELRRVGKVPTWKGGETVPASLLVAPWTVDASWFFGQGPVFFRNAECVPWVGARVGMRLRRQIRDLRPET